MSLTNEERPTAPQTDELRRVLQNLLRVTRATSSQIVRLERVLSPYCSSFPLEELTVSFDDATKLDVIFKNADPRALSHAGRRAKPEFLDDPVREIEMYRSVLDARELGTAICYGSVADSHVGRYWLFLEKVAGTELYQIGDFGLWRQVARWLAGLHHRFALLGSLPPAVLGRLVQHNAEYYKSWLERALSFRNDPLLRQMLNWYPQFVRELTALPATLIHGEFYAANILVQGSSTPPRVCAIDWERAAWGPGLIDLAALTAGKWSEAEKNALAAEYLAALRLLGDDTYDSPALLRGWNACRLHLAVQWLGWSRDWSPPSEQRQDWLTEAAQAACALNYSP